MLTPKQIEIFEVFLRTPHKDRMFKEIKAYAKEKSNSIIQKAIARFLEDDLIKKKQVGNIILYKPNLENNAVFSYFTILIKRMLSQPALRSLETIRNELQGIDFVSIAVFGSYAEGTQTKKSDLDVAIFVSSQEDKKKSERALKSAEIKTILNIDYHVFTREEMLQMLKDKHENLGKQIARKHLAVHNPAIFYAVIEEGIKNGFEVVYP